jgi:hypothetical protein
MKIEKQAAVQHPLSVITTDSLRPKHTNDINQSINQSSHQARSKKQKSKKAKKPFSPPRLVFCTLFSLTHQLPGGVHPPIMT